MCIELHNAGHTHMRKTPQNCLITVCLGENNLAWQSLKSVYKNVKLAQQVVPFFLLF